MKKLHVSPSLVEVESLKDLLEGAGIACMVRNQQSSSLAGSVPFVEVFPELWVLNDQDYDIGKELLAGQVSTAIPGSDWTCAVCGECHATEFVTCWKCGVEKGVEGSQKVAIQSEASPSGGSLGFGVFLGVCLGVAATLCMYWLWRYSSMTSTAYDRNADGKDDVVYEYKGQFPWAAKLDNDFDGYFETALFYNQAGEVIRTEIDRGRAGRPDLIEYNALGRLDSVEFIDRTTGRVKKRMYYKLDAKVREEIDEDGDGKFERVIEFDEFENPK